MSYPKPRTSVRGAVTHHEFLDFEDGVDTIVYDVTSISDLSAALPTDVSYGAKDGKLVIRYEGLGTFVHLASIDAAPFALAQTPGTLFGTENAEYVSSNSGSTFFDTDGEYWGDPAVTEMRLLGGDDTGFTYSSVPLYAGQGNDTIRVNNGGSGFGDEGDDTIDIRAGNNNYGYGNGGAGNDTILLNGNNRTSITAAGGTGADTFDKINVTQNSSYAATDTIEDFEPNVDAFLINGVAFDFNSPPVGFTLTDDGSGNTVLSYNMADTITFEGVTVAQLTTP